MAEPLVTYLNDHMGGAQIALQLLEAMQENDGEPKFQEFAASLLPAIQADDNTLLLVCKAIESSPSQIKKAGGWLLEKAARLKLGHTGPADFAMFESLELLVIGIEGKLRLWMALGQAAVGDERLRDFDFDLLAGRAREQIELVERERLDLARVVFAKPRDANAP